LDYLIGAKARLRQKIFLKTGYTVFILEGVEKRVFFLKERISPLFLVVYSILTGGLLSDFTKEYPATLHINISEKYRGKKYRHGFDQALTWVSQAKFGSWRAFSHTLSSRTIFL